MTFTSGEEDFNQAQSINPIHDRHIDIHQYQVGFQAAQRFDRCLAISSLANYRVTASFEQANDPISKQGVVIDNEDAH